MSRRYCELKLVDVLNEEKHETTKKRSKRTNEKPFTTDNKSTKLELGNFSLLKKRSERLSDTINDLTETIPVNKSTSKPQKHLIGQGEHADSDDLRRVKGPKSDITTGKRKRHKDKVENVEEPSSKKVSTSGNSHTIPSSKPNKENSQRKKRKKKSQESCWENKLTGARRVSKRLTNLRIKKQKSLKDLGKSSEISQALIKSKQPINFSARGNLKGNKQLHENSQTRSKFSYKRNRPEVQINFGKLSHTKRFYPKIAAGRRPATYTVTIKPVSVQQNSRINKPTHNEDFMNNSSDEDSTDFDVNSLIDQCVEDIQGEENDESRKEEESNTNVSLGKEKDESNNKLNPNETAEESNFVATTQEEVQTVVYESAEEEFDESSTIVIVDIESGENIKCRTSDKNQRNKQKSEYGRSDEEGNTAEKQLDFEEGSDVSEVENVIDLNQTRREEKCEIDENNATKEYLSEDNTNPEAKDKINTPAGDSKEGSLVTENVDIADTDE